MEIELTQSPRLVRFWINLPAPVIVFFINFSSLFSRNEFLGDRGDARLSIVLYEHWFSFFLGKENLTSTIFFFPATDTLGLTDAFFAQLIVFDYSQDNNSIDDDDDDNDDNNTTQS